MAHLSWRLQQNISSQGQKKIKNCFISLSLSLSIPWIFHKQHLSPGWFEFATVPKLAKSQCDVFWGPENKPSSKTSESRFSQNSRLFHFLVVFGGLFVGEILNHGWRPDIHPWQLWPAFCFCTVQSRRRNVGYMTYLSDF